MEIRIAKKKVLDRCSECNVPKVFCEEGTNSKGFTIPGSHLKNPVQCQSDPAAPWREKYPSQLRIVNLRGFRVMDSPEGMPSAFALLSMTLTNAFYTNNF